MKPEQLYQELKHLAEKLGIRVKEKSFRNTGIPVKSGLCKVKGEELFIMDRNLKVFEKNLVLAETLSEMSHENIYVVPAVREMLDKAAGLEKKRA